MVLRRKTPRRRPAMLPVPVMAGKHQAEGARESSRKEESKPAYQARDGRIYPSNHQGDPNALTTGLATCICLSVQGLMSRATWRTPSCLWMRGVPIPKTATGALMSVATYLQATQPPENDPRAALHRQQIRFVSIAGAELTSEEPPQPAASAAAVNNAPPRHQQSPRHEP